MKLVCPYCSCTEYIVIDRKEITGTRRKISYRCASCKKEWAEMKGFKRVGRYYWDTRRGRCEYKRIPSTASKVLVLGGVNSWE